MWYLLVALIGLTAGIVLDELFAGKAIAAIKYEFNFLHTKFDAFVQSVHRKLDAILAAVSGHSSSSSSSGSGGSAPQPDPNPRSPR